MQTCRCSLIVVLCAVLCSVTAWAQQTVPTEDDFIQIIRSEGVARATEVLENVLRADPDAVIFSESVMNRMGYEYLNLGRVEDGIEIFKLNVMAYPDAFNTYDSLGEAYMIHGDTELAIQNYRKSVELNPENDNAASYVFVLENYSKSEHYIRMRDGVRLFTQVYRPRDRSRSYPILLKRTPYSLVRYGPHNHINFLGPSAALVDARRLNGGREVAGGDSHRPTPLCFSP